MVGGNQIEEINKIIRELWRRTYQGGDIEDISIVSGEESGSGGRAARSYNYRYGGMRRRPEWTL